MSNSLTGEFDVVAEFSIPAINRILAAMHASERFPHSITFQVDDTVPGLPHTSQPVVVASIDGFGQPIADHTRVRNAVLLPNASAVIDPILTALDPIVNAGVFVDGVSPVTPSKLKGLAQIQLFPPSIEVTGGGGQNITVQIEVMTRYLPDPHTSALAEFVRGKLRITTSVNQVASQTANVIEVNIKAQNVAIDFTPLWSSQPLTAEDLAAIQLVIRNALKTSFLPSNSTLPAGIRFMQFKTLHQSQDAVGVLLNLDSGAGNPSSTQNVFLNGSDFAFAVGNDYIQAALKPIVDGILQAPIAPVSFSIDIIVHTFHVTYSISLNSVTASLQTGKIVITVTGHAHTSSSLPDFDFSAEVPLTLTPSGQSARLASVDDVSLEVTSGGISGLIVDLFKGLALGGIRQVRDDAIQNAQNQAAVQQALSTDSLVGFLNSLLNPAKSRPLVFQLQSSLVADLTYTSVNISPDGIVLGGSVAIVKSGGLVVLNQLLATAASGPTAPSPAVVWSPPHVEFEQIPENNSGPLGNITVHGPDYTALKSWIPGGTIQRFEWSHLGQPQPFLIDDHRFVFTQPPPLLADAFVSSEPVTVFSPLCLTVRGTQFTSSGPIIQQPVSASYCSQSVVPIINGLQAASFEALPMVALTQPNPKGGIQVTGHAAVLQAPILTGAPNLLVHFASDASVRNLNRLEAAVREAARKDAVTAILAVLTERQMEQASYSSGIVYTDDAQGLWQKMLGVKISQAPSTLLIDSRGKVAWQHPGEIDSTALVAALRKHLTASGTIRRTVLRTNLRIGQQSPNFLFGYAPGGEITLRKFAGRPVTLVFWRSFSKASIDAVLELQKAAGTSRVQGSDVIAINDGEPPDVAEKSAKQNQMSVILVTDPNRSISASYGVKIWPTIVSLDPRGIVQTISHSNSEQDRHGRSEG